MKQYLTKDQLTECPLEVRTKLVEFCKKNTIKTWKYSDMGQPEPVEPDEYNLPLFSIGQLIQYLGTGWEQDLLEAINPPYWEDGAKLKCDNEKLIDALWEAVKDSDKNGK